jgi:anti-sigma regulatory factor (Ser/Thr protein kinase)
VTPPSPSETRVTLRFRATLEYPPLAIDLVSTLIAHVSTANRAFHNELITAFGEAFNNVVTHGYRGRSDGMLDVDAEMGADWMTLHLSDTGRAVELDTVILPDLDSLPEGGLGVFMIHAMVDEVTYARGERNVLSLTKRMLSTATDPGIRSEPR